MFSTKDKDNLLCTFMFSYANAFNLDQSKILSFGKELLNLRDPMHQTDHHINRSIKLSITKRKIGNLDSYLVLDSLLILYQTRSKTLA